MNEKATTAKIVVESAKVSPTAGKLINSAVEGLVSGLNKSTEEEPAIGQF